LIWAVELHELPTGTAGDNGNSCHESQAGNCMLGPAMRNVTDSIQGRAHDCDREREPTRLLTRVLYRISWLERAKNWAMMNITTVRITQNINLRSLLSMVVLLHAIEAERRTFEV
jgi:hypothetical protein